MSKKDQTLGQQELHGHLAQLSSPANGLNLLPIFLNGPPTTQCPSETPGQLQAFL